MSLYLKLALFGLAALFVVGVVGAGYWHVQSIKDDLKAAQSAVSELNADLATVTTARDALQKTNENLRAVQAQIERQMAELEMDNGYLEQSVGKLEQLLTDLNKTVLDETPGAPNEPVVPSGAATPEVVRDLNRLLDDANRLLGAAVKPSP